MKYSKIPIFITMIVLLLVFAQVAITKTLPDESTKPETQWKKVECSWELIQKYFSHYYTFYPELYWEWTRYDWEKLNDSYDCETILSFILAKERERLTCNINPSIPERGIKKGIIIIFGKKISPPYQVTLSNDDTALVVNNIQIPQLGCPKPVPISSPADLLERSAKIGNKSDELRKEMKKLDKEWFNQYLSYLVKTLGESEGWNKFKLYMNGNVSNKIISNFWVYDDKNHLWDFKYYPDDEWDVHPEYFYPDKQWKLMVKDDPTLKLTVEDRIKHYNNLNRKLLKENLNLLKNKLNTLLLEDKVIVFGMDLEYINLTKDEYETVVTILQNENISVLTKIENINIVLQSTNPPYPIVCNNISVLLALQPFCYQEDRNIQPIRSWK